MGVNVDIFSEMSDAAEAMGRLSYTMSLNGELFSSRWRHCVNEIGYWLSFAINPRNVI